jgi:hypothetical protein
MSRVCQRCGATRDAARFCGSCGLDFWQAAADEAQPAAPPVPAAAPVEGGWQGPPVGMIAVAIGVVLLVAAGGLWVLSGLRLGSPGGGPATVASRPPMHPIITAFFREARDPDAAFAVEQTGTLSLSGPADEESYDVSAHGRLQGADYAVRLRMEGGPGAVAGDVVVVDGYPFAREIGGEWVAGDQLRGVQLESVNPFGRISTVTELEYAGPGEQNGVEGHILVTEKWLGSISSDNLLHTLGRLIEREARMEILVTDLGVPISADYTFRAEAQIGGERLTMSGTTDYTFSDWDDVEPIEAPMPLPSP